VLGAAHLEPMTFPRVIAQEEKEKLLPQSLHQYGHLQKAEVLLQTTDLRLKFPENSVNPT